MDTRVVKSHTKLALDDDLESGERNKLKTEMVQKPLEVIDKVQESLEYKIQDFSKGMPPPNEQCT